MSAPKRDLSKMIEQAQALRILAKAEGERLFIASGLAKIVGYGTGLAFVWLALSRNDWRYLGVAFPASLAVAFVVMKTAGYFLVTRWQRKVRAVLDTNGWSR